MIKTSVKGADAAKLDIQKEIEAFLTDEYVTVGIHEDEGMHAGGITNAQLGASLNYGAGIKHPGGTTYGYKTEKDAEAGKVRFLKNGEGYMSLGVTEPHTITIPARPWLEPGVNEGVKAYLDAIEKGAEKGQNLNEILHVIGVLAVAKVQEYMTQLRTPANAPSTIARKGSSSPLIDSGELRASVSYKVVTREPSEGL